MKLTDEALNELEALLREDYPDYKFTKQELLEIGNRVIRAVELAYRTIPSETSDGCLSDKTGSI